MVSEVREWLHELRRTDRANARLVGQAITALLDEGPSLGRPLVERLKGSSLHNNAVLLVAGDKAGQWKAWYRQAIPLAEDRYAAYLKERTQP